MPPSGVPLPPPSSDRLSVPPPPPSPLTAGTKKAQRTQKKGGLAESGKKQVTNAFVHIDTSTRLSMSAKRLRQPFATVFSGGITMYVYFTVVSSHTIPMLYHNFASLRCFLSLLYNTLHDHYQLLFADVVPFTAVPRAKPAIPDWATQGVRVQCRDSSRPLPPGNSITENA